MKWKTCLGKLMMVAVGLDQHQFLATWNIHNSLETRCDALSNYLMAYLKFWFFSATRKSTKWWILKCTHTRRHNGNVCSCIGNAKFTMRFLVRIHCCNAMHSRAATNWIIFIQIIQKCTANAIEMRKNGIHQRNRSSGCAISCDTPWIVGAANGKRLEIVTFFWITSDDGAICSNTLNSMIITLLRMNGAAIELNRRKIRKERNIFDLHSRIYFYCYATTSATIIFRIITNEYSIKLELHFRTILTMVGGIGQGFFWRNWKMEKVLRRRQRLLPHRI